MCEKVLTWSTNEVKLQPLDVVNKFAKITNCRCSDLGDFACENLVTDMTGDCRRILHRKVHMNSSLPPQELSPSPQGWFANNNKNTQPGSISSPQDFMSLVIRAAVSFSQIIRTRVHSANVRSLECANVIRSHKGLAPSWTSARRISASRGVL